MSKHAEVADCSGLAFFSRVLRHPTRPARDFGGSVSGLDYMCIGNMYLPIGLIGFSV